MRDTIRDSAFGQLARIVTRGRYFNYVEENPRFQFPCESFTSSSSEDGTPAEAVGDASASIIVNSTAPKEERNGSVVAGLEKAETTNGTDLNYHDRILSRDMQLALQRSTSQSIKPEKTADGKILVDWYTTDDPENPYNWSSAKKLYISFQIWYVFTYLIFPAPPGTTWKACILSQFILVHQYTLQLQEA